MRRRKKFLSGVAAFSMAAIFACSGVFDNIALMSKNALDTALGLTTVQAETTGTVDEVTGVWTSTVSSIHYALKNTDKAQEQQLASQYSTNATGFGIEKTISIDGNISDWNETMKIAQGAANDDPRVYRPNSMYENPMDLYSLYAAYDDNNLYLMWEMTNVQDVVAPNDNYPLTNGHLFPYNGQVGSDQNIPFFIAVDTGKTEDVIGNNGNLIGGGTFWNCNTTIENPFNRLIAASFNGSNGPWVYGGNSNGLNPVELFNRNTSNIKLSWGCGIVSKDVTGINKAYGHYNDRLVGDIFNNSADWVDFNTIGHNSAKMDFFYEMSIPYETLGITKEDIKTNGIGVLFMATSGASCMDCLPYDSSMNDNADLDDAAGSQENNSFEKSDEDFITCSFARIGSVSTPDPGPTPSNMKLDFDADLPSPQVEGTVLTLHGSASDGIAPYTYQYYVNDVLVDTQTGRGATQTSWTPSEGTYMIKCVVTDSTGNSVTSTKRYVVEGEVNVEELNVIGNVSSSSVKVGETITLTATATGGSTPYTYRYIVLEANTGNEEAASEFQSSNTFKWTASEDGMKAIYVEVKDAADTVVRSEAINVTVQAEEISTEEPTQPSTEEPTQPSTEEPTQPSTEEPTQPSTEEPTQPSTEEPTQPSTDPTAQVTTEEPTTQPSTTSNTGSATTTPKTGDTVEVIVLLLGLISAVVVIIAKNKKEA